MEKKRSLLFLRYLIPALLFIALAVFLLLGLGRNPNEIPSPLIDKPAPPYRLALLADTPPPAFGPLPTSMATGIPSDGTLDAQALRGAPYLLNVWASWCAPCLQEHPQMLALAKARNIHLVGLNYKDQAADARRWLHRHGNPFDTIVLDPKGRTAIDFGVYGVPETFLIDAQGQIRFKHVGPLTDDVLKQKLLPAMAAVKEVSR